MGRHSIGNFFKHLGSDIKHAGPDILHTVMPLSDPKVQKMVEKGVVGAEKLVEKVINKGTHLFGDLTKGLMMPLMIGGAVVLLIILKK